MNDEANRGVLNWLARGKAMKENYERITSVGHGAVRLDHRDFLQLRGSK